MTAAVSVVIPCLDDAPALAVCLEHLDRQTRPPTEVVVVDNGSSPDPRLQQLSAGHPYAVRVVHEPVRGAGAAAARGYDEAKGEILARCDADSRPAAGWIEAIASAFARDDGLDAVTGPVDFHDLSGWQGVLGRAFYRAGLSIGMHLAIATTPLWGSNLALRATAWERARRLVHRDDPRVHDDLDLSFALGPDARVRRLAGMRVSAEARIYDSRAALSERVARAMHTCRRGWEHQSAGLRWVERVRSR